MFTAPSILAGLIATSVPDIEVSILVASPDMALPWGGGRFLIFNPLKKTEIRKIAAADTYLYFVPLFDNITSVF